MKGQSPVDPPCKAPYVGMLPLILAVLHRGLMYPPIKTHICMYVYIYIYIYMYMYMYLVPIQDSKYR